MTEFDTNCRMFKKDFQTNDCMLKNSHIYFLCNKKMQKFCNNYWQMWKFCSTILNVSSINADVAELADAQDLKSCGWINRAGSIPAICTKIRNCIWTVSFLFYNIHFNQNRKGGLENSPVDYFPDAARRFRPSEPLEPQVFRKMNLRF